MTFTFVPGKHHLETDPRAGLIKTWSFSSLTKYERCAYSLYLGKVEGLREPSGPAADRGTAIHSAWEAYIKGETDRLENGGKKPLLSYANELREAYLDGRASVEDEWTFDHTWTPVPPKTPEVWAIFKLDVFIRESDTSARVVDHKSGRSFGNEIKHGEQGMFYAIAAMLQHPELEFVKVEFNYVDEGEIKAKSNWRRSDLPLFLPKLEKRAQRLTSATTFEPQPSKHACKWCRYRDEVKRDSGEPACIWGVL